MTIGPTSLLDVQNMLAEASREINRMRERAERAEANARDWEGNFIDMQAERDRLREALEDGPELLQRALDVVPLGEFFDSLWRDSSGAWIARARRALEGEKP